MQTCGTIVGLQVRGNDSDSNLISPLQLIGQGLHFGYASGCQHELIAIMRKLVG
jgi:hypothetical protein